MTDISNNVEEKPIEDFNALSFERKLVELVEELRLRRVRIFRTFSEHWLTCQSLVVI